jgi:hypothetical protein
LASLSVGLTEVKICFDGQIHSEPGLFKPDEDLAKRRLIAHRRLRAEVITASNTSLEGDTP